MPLQAVPGKHLCSPHSFQEILPKSANFSTQLSNPGGPGSWPIAWLFLALISLPMIGVLAIGLRANITLATRANAKVPLGHMRLLLVGYTFFGAGYIAYMTFMIAWVRNGSNSIMAQTLFWAVIGFAAMLSPWLWVQVLARCKHGHSFALLCSITVLGGVLPLLLLGPFPLLVSAALFGCSFFSVVASTTVFVRRNFPEAGWGRAIGALTVCFGGGQILGPVVIGAPNDTTGSLSSGLIASNILLVLGAVIGFLQRDC